MLFPIQVALRLTKLRGTVFDWNDEVSVLVDGTYEVSTILLPNGRSETVAFKVDGLGPEQIQEPYLVKTLKTEKG